MSKGLSYRDAGVDIEAGDALVEAIKPFARRTLRPEVLAGIGGFGALCQIPKKYRHPVLVSGTDGVGTKLKLAFERLFADPQDTRACRAAAGLRPPGTDAHLRQACPQAA